MVVSCVFIVFILASVTAFLRAVSASLHSHSQPPPASKKHAPPRPKNLPAGEGGFFPPRMNAAHRHTHQQRYGQVFRAGRWLLFFSPPCPRWG